MMSRFVMDGYRRKSLRRPDHDYYLTNIYFITIKLHERQPLFGAIEPDGIHINDAGRMISQQWHALGKRFDRADPGIFVVMPDHMHGIIVIDPHRPEHVVIDNMDTPAVSLPRVMQAFKSLTTRHYCAGVRQNGWPEFNGKLWQRSYNEHIVRSKSELDAITTYIRDNPARLWRSVYENVERNHDLE